MKNYSVDTKIASYGAELYSRLEEETGLGTSMCYFLVRSHNVMRQRMYIKFVLGSRR